MGERHDCGFYVLFGATANRVPDDLDTAKKLLHDAIIERLGDLRTGPVQWRWWPAPVGIEILDENGFTPEDEGLRGFLRAHPDGWLVVAMAPTSAEPASPLERAPCGCQWGAVDETFVFEPCSLDCDLFRHVQEEAERQQRSVTTLDLTGGASG